MTPTWHNAIDRYRPWILAAACAVAVALPASVLGESGAARPGAAQSSPRPSPGSEWSTVMGDLANRYSPLDQINTQTVSRLGAAWMERLPTPANSRAMPVMTAL